MCFLRYHTLRNNIRFRLSLSSGILELKDEVAKRLKLEMGTFDIVNTVSDTVNTGTILQSFSAILSQFATLKC